MSFLLDLSVITQGGGVQVAKAYLSHLATLQLRQKIILVVHEDVWPKVCMEGKTEHIEIILIRPCEGFFKRLRLGRKKLKEVEQAHDIKAAFTLFGPAYYKFRKQTKHIVGYAIPHHIYPKSPFFKSISIKDWLFFFVVGMVKMSMLKWIGDEIVVETEVVKERLSAIYKINKQKISVVPNAINPVFLEGLKSSSSPSGEKEDSSFNILTVSAYYPHKNLEIIQRIANEVNEKSKVPIFFHLTLPQPLFEEKFKSPFIKNHGYVPLDQLPILYLQSDLFFHPSYLECFSAAYIECQICEVPLLVQDIDFAKNICGNYAHYFRHDDLPDLKRMLISMAESGVERRVPVLKQEYLDSGFRSKIYDQLFLEEN